MTTISKAYEIRQTDTDKFGMTANMTFTECNFEIFYWNAALEGYKEIHYIWYQKTCVYSLYYRDNSSFDVIGITILKNYHGKKIMLSIGEIVWNINYLRVWCVKLYYYFFSSL